MTVDIALTNRHRFPQVYDSYNIFTMNTSVFHRIRSGMSNMNVSIVTCRQPSRDSWLGAADIRTMTYGNMQIGFAVGFSITSNSFAELIRVNRRAFNNPKQGERKQFQKPHMTKQL
jgi:hypothetical protein